MIDRSTDIRAALRKRQGGFLMNPFRFGGGSSLYSLTSLQMHCDGSSEGTTFTDSSVSPKTITRRNNPRISTAQSRFGGSSIRLWTSGVGGYFDVTSGGSTPFTFSGDFCVEFFVYFLGFGGTEISFLFDQRNGSSANALAICRDDNGAIVLRNSGGTIVSTATGLVSELNLWYHIAVSRSGTTLRTFIDGVQRSSVSNSTTFTPGLSTSPVKFGVHGFSTSGYMANVHYDEIRVIKGSPVYTANFTPPTAAFADS